MNRFLMIDHETQASLNLFLSQALSHELINESMASSANAISGTLGYNVSKGVAKIAVSGILTNKISAFDLFMNKIFGVALPVTYQGLANTITQANNDSEVKQIVLAIDSGGGYVSGIDTAIGAIRSSQKPITSEVDNLCASAAYWLASQTKQIVATSRLAVVGSIGVMVQVVDSSKAEEKWGIKLINFRSSHAPNKNLSPQDEGFNAQVQSEIDKVEAEFLADVALGRGVETQVVMEKFGAGGIKFANEAKQAGMIDEVSSLPTLTSQKDNLVKEQNMEISEEEKQALVDKSIAMERERVQGLMSILGKINTEASHKLVQDAIASGKSKGDLIDEVLELKGMEATKTHEEQGAAVINPTGVNPLAQDEVSTPQANVDGLSAEDKEGFAAMTAYYDQQAKVASHA